MEVQDHGYTSFALNGFKNQIPQTFVEAMNSNKNMTFLNGNLKEEVCVKTPESLGNEGKIRRLNKSLYELKQALRSWNQCPDNIFLACDTITSFTQIKESLAQLVKIHDFGQSFTMSGMKNGLQDNGKCQSST